MFKLEMISDYLFNIIDEILMNQKICKYLMYNDFKPLENQDLVLPADNLMRSKIFPSPFKNTPDTKSDYQLRVYFARIKPSNRTVDKILVRFSLLVPKDESMWIVEVDGKPKIKPYEIVAEVMRHFFERNIQGGFNLDFSNPRDGAVFAPVNAEFDQIMFDAELTSMTSGNQ